MNNRLTALVLATAVLVFPAIIAAQSALTSTGPRTDEEANIQAYIDLLRINVRQEKVRVLSEVMAFTSDEASSFWPIYKEYDAKLKEVGNRKLAAIREYADNYGQLTDAKADDLVTKFVTVRKERDQLLEECYTRIRAKLGGVMAARFLQVESQLLLVVDLQVASMLPAVE